MNEIFHHYNCIFSKFILLKKIFKKIHNFVLNIEKLQKEL